MRNRHHLPGFQFPFPALDLVIGNIRSRGRQRVQELCDQRSAFRLGQGQRFVFNFGELHAANIQIVVTACNRSEADEGFLAA